MSNNLKKIASAVIWTIIAVIYLAVFVLLTNFLGGFFWDIKFSNGFINGNQVFFGQLIGYWLAGLVLLLITPKKYRDFGYKLILAAVVLSSAYYELPSLVMWRIGAGVWFNFLWSVLVIVGWLAHTAVYLLSFSAIELIFKNGFKKPILTDKKILMALIVVAVVSLLLTYILS